MKSGPAVLVFTPTPTHPPIQGNRQRVFDICRAVQTMGAELTVLYYATEGLSPAEARAMRDAWGEVEVVFPRDFVPRQSLVRYPAIDDWYDDAITVAVEQLAARKRFDVCIVSYVWYSRLLEALPASVIRVIDTHDVFGGRAERFIELGLAPQWFHTSVEEETKGLNRGDFVVAIQGEEAQLLQARTEARVRTVGFLSASEFLPVPPPTPGARIRAGYIGSGNPFNVSSMLSFARAVEARPRSLDVMEIHVAGQVCTALGRTSHPFFLHGTVDSVRNFYASIDAAINPMSGGTGLKIKSLEALSFGKPLVATLDALTGIPTSHPGHQLAGPDDVVTWLVDLAGHPARLNEEGDISRRVFRSYRQAQIAAFQSLWTEIQSEIDLRRAAPAREAAGIFGT